jgi:RNA polymerase-binding transcription factor DksA
LSKPEIVKYKARLDEKYAELTRSLLRRENITIDRRPDALDEAVLAADREIEVRALDGSATLLRDVTAALRRIESGTYGTCGGCGQRIAQKAAGRAAVDAPLHQMPTRTGAAGP